MITTPEGTYRVYTEFGAANPEQRKRALLLVSRFMTWRLATSFVLTAEMRPSTAESGEDAMLAVGVSRHERVGLVQRIRRREPSYDAVEAPARRPPASAARTSDRELIPETINSAASLLSETVKRPRELNQFDEKLPNTRSSSNRAVRRQQRR